MVIDIQYILDSALSDESRINTAAILNMAKSGANPSIDVRVRVSNDEN